MTHLSLKSVDKLYAQQEKMLAAVVTVLLMIRTVVQGSDCGEYKKFKLRKAVTKCFKQTQCDQQHYKCQKQSCQVLEQIINNCTEKRAECYRSKTLKKMKHNYMETFIFNSWEIVFNSYRGRHYHHGPPAYLLR